MSDIQKTRENSHVVYPSVFAKLRPDTSGKPMIPHLLRCQRIGVNNYSLTLDACICGILDFYNAREVLSLL